MDISPDVGAKYVHSAIDFPWPFKDQSVDEIECSHYVEHIPHGDGSSDPFLQFLDEMYRVLIPVEFSPDNPNIATKGYATIVAPYYSSVLAWQDPTHLRAISEASFLYANKEWRKTNGLDHYPVSCDFDFFYNFALNGRLAGRNPEYVGQQVATTINAVDDIVVTLMRRP